MTKYYLDTEFIEDGKTIDLISLALISESGQEMHLLNADCDWSRADQWVKENVLSRIRNITRKEAALCRGNILDLSVVPDPKQRRREGELDVSKARPKNEGDYIPYCRFSDAILEFCHPEVYGKPEFIAYYADYDWVAFCQTFGKMIDLPEGFPMYCKDLKQEIDRQGLDHYCPDLHNALYDARWVRQVSQTINF